MPKISVKIFVQISSDFSLDIYAADTIMRDKYNAQPTLGSQ